jgi:hypothetical protein
MISKEEKMAITLRQLEIFLVVAGTEHMTTASQKLFLTQSAASMAVEVPVWYWDKEMGAYRYPSGKG